MSTPSLEALPLVVHSQSAAAAATEEEGFLRLPQELLNRCLGFLSWEERMGAAPASRGFDRLVTQYSFYGPPTRETRLPIALFHHYFGFLDPVARTAVPCIDRASRLDAMRCEFTSYATTAITRYCARLEQSIRDLPPTSADEAPCRLPCSFAGCDNLEQMQRKMHEIKKTIVIELSRLNDDQLTNLSSQLMIPPELGNVIQLARDRKKILASPDEGGVLAGILADADRFLMDDAEVINVGLKQVTYLPFFRTALYHLSKRVKNNGRIMLAVMQAPILFQPGSESFREELMNEYVSERLKGSREFMNALLQFYPEGIVYASNGLKNDGPFMLECMERDLQEHRFPHSLSHIGPQLRDDERFMLHILQCFPPGFTFASKRVKECLRSLLKTDPQLRDDERCVLRMRQYFPPGFTFAGARSRESPHMHYIAETPVSEEKS